MNQGDFLSSTWVCVSDQEALMALPVVLYYFWRVVPAGEALQGDRVGKRFEWIKPLASCLRFSPVSYLSLN